MLALQTLKDTVLFLPEIIELFAPMAKAMN